MKNWPLFVLFSWLESDVPSGKVIFLSLERPFLCFKSFFLTLCCTLLKEIRILANLTKVNIEGWRIRHQAYILGSLVQRPLHWSTGGLRIQLHRGQTGLRHKSGQNDFDSQKGLLHLVTLKYVGWCGERFVRSSATILHGVPRVSEERILRRRRVLCR